MSGVTLVKEKLSIKGMHCATCGLTVEKALRSLPGVVEASADPVTGEAVIAYEPGSVKLSDVVKAVRAVGYDVVLAEAIIRVPSMSSVDDERVVEETLLRMRGVAEAYASHTNRTVVVRYNPHTTSPDDVLEGLRKAGYKAEIAEGRSLAALEVEDERRLLRDGIISIAASVAYYILLALERLAGVEVAGAVLPYYGAVAFAAVLLGPGRRFLVGAYRSLRNGTPGMDALVSLGTLSIYLYSLAATLNIIKGELYYEGIGLIIGFVLIGRYIESRVKKGTGKAVESLARLKPQKARVMRGRREVEVDVGEVKPGDLVVVRQGERIPVDGYVVQGRAYVDESVFTGEPVPVEKKPGDLVLAGSMVASGWLHISATRTSGDTAIDRIASLIAYSQAGKMDIQRLADRVSGMFFWAVLGIATLTFTAWLILGGLETAIIRAASVFLISCPCALGLATPTASSAGVGVAARAGILVRNVVAFERLAKASIVVFDKTGTLTQGRPRVSAVETVEGFSEREVLELAASAEKWSEHPLARAIIDSYVEIAGRGPRDPENAEIFPGMGVYAEVEGRTVIVGNKRIMEGFEVDVGPLEPIAEKWQSRGATTVFIAVDGKPAGVIAIRDEPRPEARDTIAWLKKLGLKVMMLTGDSEGTARAVARELGIDEYRAGVSPEGKADVIRELQKNGHVVVMVGDGVNDAPSLARADVGIAVANATDVSVEAGDIVLIKGDLRRVPLAIVISRKTYNTIKFNLFWAFIYNVTLIPVAAGAFAWAGVALRPELAAAAMALSSITVTSISYRLSRWKPSLPGDRAPTGQGGQVEQPKAVQEEEAVAETLV
ncbi:heavy metal translocating P-type ATPase [Aeropyrum camini]|uniref:Cation-transporting ATPase n=1 Tax=Aeropyrum camini SY1 = JCM 12091 TaxID=1198449 RepID=U3TEC2_9CREN|nr:heavy metal translocating P-type ATPase [Aeropyrum camini]BAN90385.1 cation-transporting ATPase [Aeropyrum camini SY1 = JCM 12091]